MTKKISLNNVFLSTLGVLVLFLFTATFVTPAQASSTERNTTNASAPVVLAYYYGYNAPRYNRGPNWVAPGPRCANNCFRNQWGNMQCVRRCN